MKLVFASLLALGLPLISCQGGRTTKTQAQIEQSVDASEKGRLSKISAHAEATEDANNSNPEGNPKVAVYESNSVVRKLAGPATESDRLEAQKIVNKALSGDLVGARTLAAQARAEADKKNTEIADLKDRLKAVKADAEREYQEKLDNAQRKWQTFIFFGGGALASALGIVVLVLISNPATALSYAFLGPKLGWALLGSGLGSIALGIAVNAIQKLIDNHPWIFGIGLAIVVGLALTAAILAYGNHSHHVSKQSGNP